MKNILAVLTMSIGLIYYLVPSNSMFQTFMPRSVCMFHDQKLIIMHAVADTAIFISYFILSICLFIIHKAVKERQLPLKNFIWLFGIFIFLCGLTHLIGVLNLYVTYYWLDGAIKILCGVFSVFVAINFLPAVALVSEMKTNEEYQALKTQYEQMEQRVKLLEKGTL